MKGESFLKTLLHFGKTSVYNVFVTAKLFKAARVRIYRIAGQLYRSNNDEHRTWDCSEVCSGSFLCYCNMTYETI